MLQSKQTALLLKALQELEVQLETETPDSPSWVLAKRDLVRCRADYWEQMGQAWDLDHGIRPAARMAESRAPY